MRIVVLYLQIPIFYALYDQQNSRWIFQAAIMNCDLGLFYVMPDHLKMLNPLLVIILIPLFAYVIYPLLAYVHLRRPLQKLTTGGILAAVALIFSGILQLKIEVCQFLYCL